MLKQHKHHWVRVTNNKPWLKSFGAEVTLECSICHSFINVSEEEASNLESKTRLTY